jgi:hypothetical protein
LPAPKRVQRSRHLQQNQKHRRVKPQAAIARAKAATCRTRSTGRPA